MFRGTTPKLIFNLSFDARLLDEFYVTFSQNDEMVVEKTKADCIVDENGITVNLSQQDTLAFSISQVYVQIRGKIGEEAITHKPISISIYDILKDGEI